LRWKIVRIRGNKAETVGTVPAPDEKAAIRAAIKQYKIDKPEQQRRLAALGWTSKCFRPSHGRSGLHPVRLTSS
jgi:hypothetical protein